MAAKSTVRGIDEKPRAATLVPMDFNATLATLKTAVEPGLIKQREGWRDRNGNVHMVDYVEWHTVADVLDQVAPEWSHQIRGIKEIGATIAVTAAITIADVTREGIGTGAANSELGIKKAEHDALKRAAVKFGIARELYVKEESSDDQRTGNQSRFNQVSGGRDAQPQQNNNRSRNYARDFRSGGNHSTGAGGQSYQIRNPNEPMTEPQRSRLEKLCRDSIPPNELAMSKFDVSFGELTKGQASELINSFGS